MCGASQFSFKLQIFLDQPLVLLAVNRGLITPADIVIHEVFHDQMAHIGDGDINQHIQVAGEHVENKEPGAAQRLEIEGEKIVIKFLASS